jgi:hypothetical protein
VSLAAQYAGLVGKYISMERPATEDELAENPEATSIGMECLVGAVQDRRDYLGLPVVAILADYGYEFTVATGEGWAFTVWPDEASRRGSRA